MIPSDDPNDSTETTLVRLNDSPRSLNEKLLETDVKLIAWEVRGPFSTHHDVQKTCRISTK